MPACCRWKLHQFILAAGCVFPHHCFILSSAQLMAAMLDEGRRNKGKERQKSAVVGVGKLCAAAMETHHPQSVF